MRKLELDNVNKKNIQYDRKTAQNALNNVLKRIKEANKNEDFIYKITKAVLFGSYINSDKEKIGDLDIAIYVELKDKTKAETDQNYERYKSSSAHHIPFIMQFYYGKEEIFKYIKDKKKILQLHDAVEIENEAKRYNEDVSYIYIDKYKVIYELKAN